MNKLQEEINLIVQYYDDIDTKYSHRDRELYLRYISNMKFFGDISSSKDMFVNLMKVKTINRLLISDHNILSLSKIHNDNGNTFPCIYVTLHLGAYQIIPDYLLFKGVNICIPVTHRVYMEQFDDYMTQFELIKKKRNAEFELTDIEDTSGLIKLIKCIKRGYSLLFYIDGNSGVGGMERTDDKLISVDFMKKQIMARKGLGFLSYKFQLPIQPIITYVDINKLRPEIIFLRQLSVDSSSQNKELYEECVTKEIWNIFQEYIKSVPDQWEGWLYVEAFLKKGKMSKISFDVDKPFKFNSARYDFLIKEKIKYLYDMQNNVLLKLSDTLYSYVNNLHLRKDILTMRQIQYILRKDSLINDILEHNILINM